MNIPLYSESPQLYKLAYPRTPDGNPGLNGWRSIRFDRRPAMNFAKWVLCACIVFSMAGRAAAQDRMPPIPADKMTDAQKKAAADLLAGPRTGLNGPFIPLM